jgi:hypothetical protein
MVSSAWEKRFVPARKDELLDTLLLEVVKSIDRRVDIICAHRDGLNVIGHGHCQSAALVNQTVQPCRRFLPRQFPRGNQTLPSSTRHSIKTGSASKQESGQTFKGIILTHRFH